jgi:hypothetical protein
MVVLAVGNCQSVFAFEISNVLRTLCYSQRVTKRCKLSWLTNSALVHEPKCGGGYG